MVPGTGGGYALGAKSAGVVDRLGGCYSDMEEEERKMRGSWTTKPFSRTNVPLSYESLGAVEDQVQSKSSHFHLHKSRVVYR